MFGADQLFARDIRTSTLVAWAFAGEAFAKGALLKGGLIGAALFTALGQPAVVAKPLSAALVSATEEVIEQAYLAELDGLERRLFTSLSQAAPDAATELAAIAGQQAGMVADATVTRQQYRRELMTFLKRQSRLHSQAKALAVAAKELEIAQTASQRLRTQFTERHGTGAAETDPAVAHAAQLSDTLVAVTRQLAAAGEAYRAIAARVDAGEHPSQIAARSASDDFNAALARHVARVRAQRNAQAAAVERFDAWWGQQKTLVTQAQGSIDGAFSTYSKYRKVALAKRDTLTQTVSAYNAAVEDGGDAQTIVVLRADVDVAQLEFDASLAAAKAAQGAVADAEALGQRVIARVQQERAARHQVLRAAKEAMDAQHQLAADNLKLARIKTAAQVADSDAALKAELASALVTVRATQQDLAVRFGGDYRALHGALKLWLEYQDSRDLLALQAAPDSELDRLQVAVRETRITRSEADSLAQEIRVAARDLQVRQASYEELKESVARLSAGARAKADALSSGYRQWSGRLQDKRKALAVSLNEFVKARPQLKPIRNVGEAAAGVLGLQLKQLIAALGNGNAAASTLADWQNIHQKLNDVSATHAQLVAPVTEQPGGLITRLLQVQPGSSEHLAWAKLAVARDDSDLQMRAVTDMGVARVSAYRALAAALVGGLGWGLTLETADEVQLLGARVTLTKDGGAITQ